MNIPNLLINEDPCVPLPTHIWRNLHWSIVWTPHESHGEIGKKKKNYRCLLSLTEMLNEIYWRATWVSVVKSCPGNSNVVQMIYSQVSLLKSVIMGPGSLCIPWDLTRNAESPGAMQACWILSLYFHSILSWPMSTRSRWKCWPKWVPPCRISGHRTHA